MNRREQQALLLLVGFGMLIGGHRIVRAEFGSFGVPQVIGGVAVAAALRI